MPEGGIHKIAVLSKDYYSIRTTDDLFIFAGADPDWWAPPANPDTSERVTNVYGWVEAIRKHAPSKLDRILSGVAAQMSENNTIPEGDRKFLQRVFSVSPSSEDFFSGQRSDNLEIPDQVEQLLERLIRGLPRAMFPLRYRRTDLCSLEFDNEYDVQTLLHTLLRPWIRDVRVEEYTPSYAGKSARTDFLLPKHGIVIEVKYVRSSQHAKKIGEELIIDIAHYRVHPKCSRLWAVVYDPNGYIQNPDGLSADLDGNNEDKHGTVQMRTFILSG